MFLLFILAACRLFMGGESIIAERKRLRVSVVNFLRLCTSHLAVMKLLMMVVTVTLGFRPDGVLVLTGIVLP
jgi:ABC-type iron transport system FetAB permease component